VSDADRAPTVRRMCTPGAAAFGEFFGMILCSAATVYAVWSTVIAFAGGRLPLTEVHLSGGVGLGFAWIFVADPLIMSLALAVTYVLTVPIGFWCAFRYRRALQRSVTQRVPVVDLTEPEPHRVAAGDGAPAAERTGAPVLARPRPDGTRPRGEPTRRTQPANRHRELVGPDTP